ncbi:GNAT family N-acetyltransferase [Sphingomonas histidinilytica]|uniref:GNAT family N-acetyltransferase n=1 Tax=Rhizorhabdus histidinilytica TaxID=439228 RepID=UPI001ADC3C6B|nr:GNAT family N-acetyltransferase [Rhizorhabdus histidinilytica]MBO9380409.1 GNAT family N-acetyltransferase [Rhizorhabdus histidinilytica]
MDRIDAGLIAAWLAARSMARDLPAPVPDRGGWRVDTGLPSEARRHVFTAACPGLVELGATVAEPRVLLKLAATYAELAALLPPRWRLEPLAFVMTCAGGFGDGSEAELPGGYQLSVERDGDRAFARIVAPAGVLAASGHAAERDGVFIYDRIVTDAAHRRRGLGRALMLALQRTRRSPAARQVLTATADGRALYTSLGWQVHCPWSTAAIPE